MRKWIAFFILAVITIASNIFLSSGERSVFDAKNLPSALVEGEQKAVEGGQAGNLTFGPYVALKKGTYEVQIFYKADTDINTWDVFSHSQQIVFASGSLTADDTVVVAEFVLEEKVEDIEVRTFYQGQGLLEVEKMVLIKNQSTIQGIVNLLFLFLLMFLFSAEKKNYRQLAVALFMTLILCPLILMTSQSILDKKLDVELEGNFESYDKPHFSLDKFCSGEYQDKFEQWWNNSFASRAVLVKAYNQFRYSVLGQGNRVVGKNGDIFEENYIFDVLCIGADRDFSLAENRVALQTYYETLVRLQKKLEARGKLLYVYTTPNKAEDHYVNIPSIYKTFKEEGKVRAIDLWRELISSGELNYLDAGWSLQNTEYPLFYLTGIHWSRPAEQTISAMLVQNMNRGLNNSIKPLVLGELMQSEEPFWRDADVYEVLNIYRGKTDDYYYEYQTEAGQGTGEACILMQGDSFALGFREDFKKNRLGASITNIFYNEYVIENDDSYVPITSWEAFDFGKYVNEADVVVIETNEALLHTYNRGFAEALEAWLDSNSQGVGSVSPEITLASPEAYIDFSIAKDYSGSLIRGYYQPEAGSCWMAEYSMARIQSEEIGKTGLQIELVVPRELSAAKEIVICINDIAEKKITAEAGAYGIAFAPEELPQDTDLYEVEIFCDAVFNPKELGISADSRDLSVQIMYIGECR